MTCPYCGHRDVKADSDACATCEEPLPAVRIPDGYPWRTYKACRRHREKPPQRFYWRGEWRSWDRRAA